ncbi:ABC-F family ATP-binding cassette domain-containing protein [Parasporobacterium paucivorans]|uniref:ATP-binding cassette, subfamily F, uup n=1 Tax=Parasporobacterium paucivorans DSM 15970 TaxID=1122934 RepID=A0A1M6J2Y2_9FIRM|nr:ABC-F family ATP-binding cassette domain-containing protein [Parasporobacterium paucivorans]SHJ41048.1 ATP-binding cassette, subfamily F, uup [Parasporobacterium paucivorans DSM 15970]
MNLLTINGMRKSYTDRILLDSADFSINEGEKVGIIGVNGTGKSTLLKVAAGLEPLDAGEVVKGSNVKINYLPQDPVFPKGITIYDYVIAANISGDNRWEIEGEAKNILNKLGLPDYGAVIDNLSGGQKKRAALAAVLLKPCDILILDEPTNHMDNEMAAWLEDYLNKRKEALIMITHDRYFLDRIVNRVVEIDKGKIYSYNGKYADYLEQKTLREEIEQSGERKRQSILKVELEWIRRGARARSTKQKAHIQRYEALRDAGGPAEEESLQMSSLKSRMGRKTIEIEGLSKSCGDRVLINDFNYIFLNGDRIGFIGRNGCGKSTLLKMIMGEIQPDSGVIDIGSTVKIGYFSQENENLPQNMRVIDYVRETADFVKTASGSISASQMLTRFLFDDALQYQSISRLSGGEKRRLCLLKILMEAPNVLILDEPTNDLDIQTMAIFEDYLDDFDGIVIAVSHDRYFLNRITDRIFAFKGNGVIRQYEGNYEDYLNALQEEENPTEDKTAQNREESRQDKSKPRMGEDKVKMSFNEKREFESIDEEIAKLEARIDSLEKEIAASATDFIRLTACMKEKEEAQEALEGKMERWIYLMELNELINKK